MCLSFSTSHLIDDPTKNAMARQEARVWEYDENETRDYQIRQLPTESTFSSPDWEEVFLPFRGSKPTVERQNDAPGAANLAWKIDPPALLKGAYVDFDEFCYDEDGYVCRLGPEPAPVNNLGRRSEDVSRYREFKERIVSCSAKIIQLAVILTGSSPFQWTG